MGGGKSFVTVAYLLVLAKIYRNSKWVIIRDSRPTIKRTVLETFFRLCPKSFIRDWNQTDLIATFTNGSRIIFMGEDYVNDKDFNKFKGLEVNGFLLEQIEELNEGLLDVCLIRAGRWDIDPMPPPVILATVNPTQKWVKKRIYDPFINGTLPEKWFYLPSTLNENPRLLNDEAYMSNLRQMDHITYRRYVEGDWTAFAVDKPFAYAFDEQKHCKNIPFDPALPLQLSFDFNVDPITAIALQSPSVGNLNVLREFRIRNSDIYDLCEMILAAYPNKLYMVTGDASGAGRSAIAKGNINYYTVIREKLHVAQPQLKVPSVNPSISDTRVLLNSILQNGNVTINPECQYLIDDLKFVEVNESGDIDKKSNSTRSHLLDTLRYAANTFHRNFLRM